MNSDELEFVPRSKLSELRNRVNNGVVLNRPISASGKTLTDIEKAELLESLGTLEFYEGNWQQAIEALKPSLLDFNQISDRRIPEQLVSSFILYGIAQFKLGELENALATMETASKLAQEKKLSSLGAKALSNRAMICCRMNRFLEAISFCREALELSAEVNYVGSFEHLQHARLLIHAYIKIRDYEKAENVVESFMFSKDEKLLLLGGVQFAAGSVAKAGEVLYKLIGSQFQSKEKISTPDSNKSNKLHSAISSDDFDKAIEHIEQDLEQWSIAESKSEDMVNEGSVEDPELIKKRQEDENQIVVKIERIVERSITLYNSSLFMPPQPQPDKMQRLKSASTSPSKTEDSVIPSASMLQQSAMQSLRLQQLAMDSLKQFVRKLRKRRSVGYDDRKYDAFERVPWNLCPDLLSNDLYMYPAICWAILLQANAERYLQDSVQFNQGLRIQRGDVVLSTEDYQEQLDAAESFFSKAIQVVEAARFHGGYETVDEEFSHKHKSIASNNSIDSEEEMIKSAAVNLAAAFDNTASATSNKAPSPAKEAAVAEPKTRQTSNAAKSSKRGSAATTAPHRRGPSSVQAKAHQTIEKTQSVEETVDVSTIISQMTSMNMHLADTIDTSLLKDVFLNAKQLIAMNNEMRSNRLVMAAASKSLTRQGITDFNPWTGQLGSNPLPSLSPTTNAGAKVDEHPSIVVGETRDPTSSEKKGVQITYKPKQDDPLSLRSELLPSSATFGMDEATSWIHWALGAVGGISLGFLGHTCMSAQELIACVTVDSEQKKTKNDSLNESAQEGGPRLPEAFLIEVRNRLLEVDTKLTLTDEIDVTGEDDPLEPPSSAGGKGSSRPPSEGNSASGVTKKRRKGADYLLTLPSGQLETRLLLLFILVKITAELHWKKELLPSLLQLEQTYEILRQRYGPSIAYRYELVIYGAMIQKFRLEYDEWLLLSSEVMGDSERVEVLVSQILPRAKKYYQSAEEMMTILQAVNNNPVDPMARDNGQMYLMKDAVRKLANVYIGIGNIPIKIQPAAPRSGGFSGRKKNKPEETAPPAPTVQAPGTMEELERFTDREIEDKEKNEIKWVQKFGRARAQAIYRKFRSQFSTKLPSPPKSATERPTTADDYL